MVLPRPTSTLRLFASRSKSWARLTGVWRNWRLGATRFCSCSKSTAPAWPCRGRCKQPKRAEMISSKRRNEHGNRAADSGQPQKCAEEYWSKNQHCASANSYRHGLSLQADDGQSSDEVEALAQRII